MRYGIASITNCINSGSQINTTKRDPHPTHLNEPVITSSHGDPGQEIPDSHQGQLSGHHGPAQPEFRRLRVYRRQQRQGERRRAERGLARRGGDLGRDHQVRGQPGSGRAGRTQRSEFALVTAW